MKVGDEQYIDDKDMWVLGIAIFVIFAFFMFAWLKPYPKQDLSCYNKIMNSTEFWIFKEIQNENKTFIYCNKDLWNICFCQFYWGSGMVTYKDDKGDMPYWLKKDGD